MLVFRVIQELRTNCLYHISWIATRMNSLMTYWIVPRSTVDKRPEQDRLFHE